jgi:iron complex outermembrane recepter protein
MERRAVASRRVRSSRVSPGLAGAAPLAAILLATLVARTAFAEEDAAPVRIPAAEEIVVTAHRLPEPRSAAPASLSVLGPDEIHTGRSTVDLDEPLRRVPGVVAQTSGNFAQDLRIQIRGFGTRAQFGVREIRVMTDGLPENVADGQTQLDGIELGGMQRIEVLRGPAAALYGNASGGVIHLITEDPPDEPGARVRLTGGTFGLFKGLVAGGASGDSLSGFGTGSYTTLDGYRDHSSLRVGTVSARLDYEVSPETDLHFLLDFVDSPKAQDPGGLTREQTKENPRQARDLNRLLDAGESVVQTRAGIVGDYAGDLGAINAYAFLVYRDFFTKLPVLPELGDGITRFERLGPGGGLRWTWDRPILGFAQSFSVGADGQYQDDDRQRYLNENGATGALTVDQIEKVTAGGIYLREAVWPIRSVEVDGAIRYDVVHYQVDVRFPTDGDGSGTRTMDAWSPAGSVAWEAAGGLRLHTGVGTSFQAPTTTELDDPNGPGFVSDLQPQTSVTWEIGAVLDRFAGIRVGLAAYRIHVTDLIVPFETFSGEIAFRNAGDTRRYGVEVDWQVDLPWSLDWSGAVTWIDAKYVSYDVDAGDFSGNQEPGIPPWVVFQELSATLPYDVRAALELFYLDTYFVDDANLARTPSYALLNLRLGWEYDSGPWQLEPFLALNNLTDTYYDGTVRLNALGGRFFEPAPDFNLYGGLLVRWGA